jgi:hypothetical protein
MASPAIAAKKDRWVLAIGYGLLAEIATIATIVAVMVLIKFVIFRGLPEAEYAAMGTDVGGYIGGFGGAIYTYVFARRLMPRISAHFSEHGIVVALAAITLSIVGSIVGHQGVPVGYIFASILKIVAGARAGFVQLRALRVHSGGDARL